MPSGPAPGPVGERPQRTDRPPPAVLARGLHVTRRGRPILRDLSFRIPAGSVTGVVGPAGAGKTTLLRCLIGVERPSSGELTVLGHGSGDPALRRRIGYRPQAGGLYDDLTAAENLRFFARLRRVPGASVREVADRVGLPAERDSVPGRMTPGDRARLALAVALLGGPDLLLLDEPTSGLDPETTHQLWRLLHELATDGSTVVVAGHGSDEASRCSRLLVLRDGGLLSDDTPGGLRASTGTGDLAEAFLRLAQSPGDSGGATG